MNGIGNSTRFAGSGDGSGTGIGTPPDRDWGPGKERKRIPCENDISANAARGHGGGRCATRAEIETGEGKTNLRLAGANDVSTVRPTGAITSGILQSLRLYLVARVPCPSVSVTF